jgi:hypothetical protein
MRELTPLYRALEIDHNRYDLGAVIMIWELLYRFRKNSYFK